MDCADGRMLQALERASAIMRPGQVLWRGSAWVAQIGYSWDERGAISTSCSRQMAEGFVTNPGWPWPEDIEHITIGDDLAQPALARIEIGRGVRAVPLAQLMEIADDAGHELMFGPQAIYEDEVTLLPQRLTVVDVVDGIVCIKAGT
jgi:hypothetical protein